MIEALGRGLGDRADAGVAARILAAALAAVDPAEAIRRGVSRDATSLVVGSMRLPLRSTRRVWCIAVGKAAVPMARALVDRVGEQPLGGVVVTKHGPSAPLADGRLPVILGAHPVPDARSEAAGAAVLGVLDRVEPEDVVLVLLSGGASSLMVAPAPGVSVQALRDLSEALIHGGASIEQINAVRARLDRLKGGGLARLAAPARVVTLVLDDVVDAPLHVVGSGPTMAIPPGGPSAEAVLERFGVRTSAALRQRLTEGEGSAPTLPEASILRLAGNDTAVAAALACARAEGFDAHALPPVRGEARRLGPRLVARITQARPAVATAWVGGGETTVTVRGRGRGGRNQELALAAMPHLAGTAGCLVVTLATDGEDGPTDAAGAVVDGESLARARALGLSPQARLIDNDAYTVFEALGDLLRIGPTGTNVCDLVLALVRP